jgi:hypothetical protein
VKKECEKKVAFFAALETASLFHEYGHIYDEIVKRYPHIVDKFGFSEALRIEGTGVVQWIYEVRLIQIQFVPGKPQLKVVKAAD